MDLDRLRELAREPERMSMLKSQQFPSMTSEVLRQKQEIAALRRGLSEAIVEIEGMRVTWNDHVQRLNQEWRPPCNTGSGKSVICLRGGIGCDVDHTVPPGGVWV